MAGETPKRRRVSPMPSQKVTRYVSKEADVQRAVLAYLCALGLYHWRQNNTGLFDPRIGRYRPTTGLLGVADILGVLPDGRFLAIECKSTTGKPSEAQIAFLANVNARGGLAFVARSLDDAKEHLEAYRASRALRGLQEGVA